MTNQHENHTKIGDKLFSANKKIEDTVVSTHNKIADKFVDSFLKRENETTEEARNRLEKEKIEREIKSTKKKGHHK